MVDFADIADLVADVITSEGLGAEVTFSSLIPGTYNPATGAAMPAGSETTVQAIVEDYRGAELMSGAVAIGDKKVSIPAPSLTDTPKPGDQVQVSDVTYFVERVTTEQAGGVAILHVLHCRKA